MERGFSINKESIIENQNEKSLIARRVIYDAIDAMDCRLHEFIVDKQLIKGSHMSYNVYKELAKEKGTWEKEKVFKKLKIKLHWN